MARTYALVTGASQGIGKALACECASRGFNLVLVALPEPELEVLADSIRQKYGVEVHVIGCDLCQNESLQRVYDECVSHGLNVSFLVNNVGLGFLGYFEEAGKENIDRVIRLNIMAVTILCKLFIPMLKLNTPGYILNVASLAAYTPMPFKSIYAASKSYVYSFSRALREELRPAQISVSILNPGPVLTNPNTRKASESMGLLARMGIVPVEALAHRTIRRTLRGKGVTIPGIYNIFLVFIQRWLPPSFVAKSVARVFRHTQYGSPDQRTHY